MQRVTRGPLEAGGYDQPKGWSNSGAKVRGLCFMSLQMLAFGHRATKAFLGLDFNLQVLDEEEAEESVSKDNVNPKVFSDTPSSVPLLGEVEIPAEAGSSPSPVGALPSDTHGLEARTTKATRSSTPNI